MKTPSAFRLVRTTLCAFVVLAFAALNHAAAAERPAAMPAANGKLAGKSIVLAGRLPDMTSAQATALIEKAGGTVGDRVTKTTHFVVAGERPGKKVDEARSLGIRVIDEAELRRMLDATAEQPVKKKKAAQKK